MCSLQTKEIRVVIAEDHELVRQGFIVLIEEHPRIKVVGQACNGKELLDVLKTTEADVVITDLEMPVMNGDEAFIIIRQRFSDIKVIILSMHYTDALVTDFISKGAAAYLGKGCNDEEFGIAICSAYDKGYYYNNENALAMSKQLQGQSTFTPFNKITLTEREIEILKCICEDMTNKEIAERLKIEPTTVDFHRQNIYKKTNCKKPAGLALYAVRNGLISAND
jgi:DNA-binding NarL/FixJ family response regulator